MKMKVLFGVYLLMNSAFILAEDNKYLNNNIGGWFFKKDTTFDNVGKSKKEVEPEPEVGLKIESNRIEIQVPQKMEDSPQNELERQGSTQYEPSVESPYVLQTKPEKGVEDKSTNKNRKELSHDKPKYDIQLK